MAWNKVSPYQTKITNENGVLSVVYRGTEIVRATATEIRLSTGGWPTVTTKRKMNQTARQFGLDFSVFQKSFDWYVVAGDDAAFQFDTNSVVIFRDPATGKCSPFPFGKAA